MLVVLLTKEASFIHFNVYRLVVRDGLFDQFLLRIVVTKNSVFDDLALSHPFWLMSTTKAVAEAFREVRIKRVMIAIVLRSLQSLI